MRMLELTALLTSYLAEVSHVKARGNIQNHWVCGLCPSSGILYN
jgi:hypothetical protein